MAYSHRTQCLLGVAALLALAGCQENDVKPTVPLGDLQVSQKQGYRIRIPKGWRRSETPRPGCDMEFLGPEDPAYTPTLRIFVEKQVITPDEAMFQDFLKALDKSYEASYSGYRRVSSRVVHINGRLAVQSSARYQIGDRVYQNLETFVSAGGRRFRIVLTALAKDFRRYAAAGESAAATFEVFKDMPYQESRRCKDFDITPPPGWIVAQQQIAGVAVAYVEPKPKQRFAANLTVEVQPLERVPNLEEMKALRQDIQTAVKARIPSAEFLSVTELTVANHPALRFVVRAKEKLGPVVRHQTVVFAPGRHFVITFSCLASDYPKWKKAFEQCVAGFQIKPARKQG